MTNDITLSEDEFNARFTLRPNPLNPHATWDGNLFETYGAELEFIRNQDPRTIWTILDGEDGDLVVASGCHFVNRIGYLITSNPAPEGESIQFTIPMSEDAA